MAAAIGYDAHSTDFAQLARRITAVRPDVLFVAAYVDDGVALRQAVISTGVPLVAEHRHQLQLLHARVRRPSGRGRGGRVRVRQARR